MLKSRLWRSLILFLTLYLVFIVIFFRTFSSDNHKDIITRVDPPAVHMEKVNLVAQRRFVHHSIPTVLQIESIQKSLKPIMTIGVLGNYEEKSSIKADGPGEYGEGVMLKGVDVRQGQESVAEYGFNEVASEKISLDRHARDTRPDECKYWQYPSSEKLPTASVILVFHNEGWSTLVRTIHSVINTSPKELLKDVILVDDYSDQVHITVRLPEYIKKWNGLVRYIRTGKRVGLVEARVIGARAMKSDVIVILDAHCECVPNWLPPLLTRIALNRKTVAVPIVDGIEWNTLQHNKAYGGTLYRGIWEWGFLYKETELPQRERSLMKYSSEPYKSPTHAGGLLAIEKNWFFQLGGYDPDIKIWGGEQYELSFKVWMCGGQIEWVPCSHVGHIYRGPRRRNMHPRDGNPYQSLINHLRVAEIWMDEYKEYYLRRHPNQAHINIGDTSKYKELRKNLNCSNFKWFLDNVAYEMAEKYPLPPANLVWGEMRHDNDSTQYCADALDNRYGHPIGVSACHHMGGNQFFQINVDGEWSAGEHCYVSENDQILARHCIQMGRWIPKGEWIYDEKTRQVRSNKVDKCVVTDGVHLFLKKCQENSTEQRWVWKEIYLP